MFDLDRRVDPDVAAAGGLWGPELAAWANQRFEGSPAAEILAWAHQQFGKRLLVTSSMADTVMIHLIELVAPGNDVVFLDTGYHFVETIGTRDAVAQTYKINLINVTAELSVEQQDAQYGKNLFARDPDACCGMRKVAPLSRALEGYDAWATGLRRADSPSRADTPVVSWDARRGKIKIAPVADWTDEQVADYIDDNQLITNPLLEDGYPSIGCAPCTKPADPDDPRAGRWAGLGKTECGIHL